MKQIKEEIKNLEQEVSSLLEPSIYFPGQRVDGLTLFELEKLKLKISSKANTIYNLEIPLILFSATVGMSFQIIPKFIFEGEIGGIIAGLIIYIFIIFIVRLYDQGQKKIKEKNLYGIGLIDMLIEKRIEIEEIHPYRKRRIRK
ncbi:hypothetical protein SAMN04488134_102133 [Amphibacillus marinus]|uniref:Uncharacterized protein n=1 Tax=Amphibacillus marinus TaxID=872970 RepID=A0A1H8K1H6_9BACI|nr:hypothetical protein [Amphibacillus marinus]SEN86631.1 hypothetical protein SAMN04488134_102133 [Amphibacillus marinus]